MPVVYGHEHQECLMTVQWYHVEPEIDHDLHQHIQMLDQRGHPVTFYTDGSCFHPDLPEYRYAAFAVVLDCAMSDDSRALQALN